MRSMRFAFLLLTLACCSLGSLACNDIGLFGANKQPTPKDTEPPGWNPTYGPDKYFYFWRIVEDQTNDKKGKIMRVPIDGSAPAQTFWADVPGAGVCVGCHAISHDGKYMSVVELVTRIDLHPHLQILATHDEVPAATPEQIYPFGDPPPEGTFGSWEPTDPSNRVVFSSPFGLQIGNVSSGSLFTLSATTQGGTLSALMPSWGPTGKIVYAAGPYGDNRIVLYSSADLWTVNADGTDPQLLYHEDGRMSYNPEWSPNGKWIAFTSSPAGVDGHGDPRTTFASTDSIIKILDVDTGEVFLPDDLDATTHQGRSWATWSAVGNRLTCGSIDGTGDSDVYETEFDPASGEDWDAHKIDFISTSQFEHIPRWAP